MALNVNIPTTNGLHVEFTAGWQCFKVYGCSWWKPATGVFWSRLLPNTFAGFYDSTTCYAGGKPKGHVYYTRQGMTEGEHAFKTPMPIRSMMIGFNRNYTRRPSVIVYNRHCRLLDTDYETAVMATNSTDLWDDDDSSADWGLSSNWTTPLPE
ncbi:hypothetical protein GN244_ATG10281 [Phytophthora infestans]|uniref:Uncharacterized protein n=1 Tax=Phytophthora infestans TaxID=4787 RepID=A0A833SPC8_PHYIN|nr:hypothetical protein GN244_ATG10281 [Phytophthora infestans]KAF4139760.1 hypothetical protein GN958_ATG11001 [Phytophthora infestans]